MVLIFLRTLNLSLCLGVVFLAFTVLADSDFDYLPGTEKGDPSKSRIVVVGGYHGDFGTEKAAMFTKKTLAFVSQITNSSPDVIILSEGSVVLRSDLKKYRLEHFHLIDIENAFLYMVALFFSEHPRMNVERQKYENLFYSTAILRTFYMAKTIERVAKENPKSKIVAIFGLGHLLDGVMKEVFSEASLKPSIMYETGNLNLEEALKKVWKNLREEPKHQSRIDLFDLIVSKFAFEAASGTLGASHLTERIARDAVEFFKHCHSCLCVLEKLGY